MGAAPRGKIGASRCDKESREEARYRPSEIRIAILQASTAVEQWHAIRREPSIQREERTDTETDRIE